MPVSRKRKKPKPKMTTNQNMQRHESKDKGSVTVQRASYNYSGIIPPPEMMSQYEQIQPGFANRILTMAEKEGDARRDNNKSVIRKAFRMDITGQIFGFLSVIVVAVLAYLLIFHGAYKEAATTVSVVMVSLAAVFVTKRKRSDNGQSKKK